VGNVGATLDALTSIWQGGSAMGTFGVGLPFATWSGLGRPGRPVCRFTGEGAFGFSLRELPTAAPHRCGHGARGGQKRGVAGPSISPWEARGKVDCGPQATAVGGWGVMVTTQSEFGPALRRALELATEGKVCLVRAQADPRMVSNLLRPLDELGLM